MQKQKQIQYPTVQKELIDKYMKEFDIAKQEHIYQSEKEKICPLYPLVTFPKMSISITGAPNNARKKAKN